MSVLEFYGALVVQARRQLEVDVSVVDVSGINSQLWDVSITALEIFHGNKLKKVYEMK